MLPDVKPRPVPSVAERVFLDPDGRNRALARSLLHDVVDLLVEMLSASPPALPAADAGSFFSGIPAEGDTPEVVLARLRSVVQASAYPGARGWMGHMDPPSALAGVAGQIAAALLNNNMLSWEMSPALSRLETELLAELAGRFGLPSGAGGVLVDGGSLGNLQALAVARGAAGLGAIGSQDVVLASDQAHVSFDKAVRVLGLGMPGLRRIPTSGRGALDPDAVYAAVTRVREQGDRPICLVATAGTTVTGAIDPLDTLADAADELGLWFHVDAAFGGAFALTSRRAGALSGIGRADSLIFNPQKWLCVAKTCAALLFRDVSQNLRHFAVAAPYMAERRGEPNLGEIGLQGTRSAGALKLWLTLTHLGQSGIDELIDHSLDLAGQVHAEILRRPHLVPAGSSDTAVVCFRLAPPGFSGDLDDLNAHLLRHLRETAGIALSLPVHRGSRWLRVVPINPYIGPPDVRRLFDALDSFWPSGKPREGGD